MNTCLVSVVIPCFRDGPRAAVAASKMLLQRLPTGVDLEVIVVDDGSGDLMAAKTGDLRDPRARVLRLESNQGRSSARNAGAQSAGGAYIVFMDCDCLPLGNDFLASHLDALASGAIASTGDVTGEGGGFWDRYQRDASLRRQRQHREGMAYSGSSQNLAVLRSEFEAVGGFDIGYTHYGFEDRDLLLRLASRGAIAWSNAVVRHLDQFDLPQVSRKMAEAGAWSSPRFADTHPRAYRALGFARLDARRRRWLGPLARAIDGAMPLVSRGVDPLLRCRWLPYVAKATLARMITALSYLGGTSRAGPAPD